MSTFKAYAAKDPKGALETFEYQVGELGTGEVEIKVDSCGICHSDLSMLDNEWGQTQYPFVPGHEVVGTVSALGSEVPELKVGQKVGLGWFSQSCMHCHPCLSGDHNMCQTAEQTIVNRHGGFADKVRCHWSWALPLPDDLDFDSAGPLFCGGITVFNPIVQFGVKPTDNVGVIGIGGLGHLAIQFLNKWGCHVSAFTSSPEKAEEAKKLGAHDIINSRSDAELEKAAGRFDFIISTVNVGLNWDAYIQTLNARGRLHFVGAVLEPLGVSAFPMIVGQKSISGTPLGSPATTAKMLEFCVRHDIKPVTETFKMSEANKAIQHLRDGKARYRVVLKSDF